jgi:cyclopropane-fatty-acyl-phospholipid synthase
MPAYFAFLRSRLRPRGRLLNHCITRPDDRAPSFVRGGFINRYVFPDGELSGPGLIISTMTDAGLELRHEENFREHYARTLSAWIANLEDHWPEAVAEVGERRARVWRLYLAGSQVGFERRDALELHQVLGVRAEAGDAGMPLRNHWERPGDAAREPLGTPSPEPVGAA